MYIFYQKPREKGEGLRNIKSAGKLNYSALGSRQVSMS